MHNHDYRLADHANGTKSSHPNIFPYLTGIVKKSIMRAALLGLALFWIMTMLFLQLPAQKAYAATSPSFPDQTRVGIHNTYDKAKYTYLVDALNSGAGLIELDVWQNFLLSGHYWVTHNAISPVGNDNNCESATSYSQLRQQNRNQDFASCLDDIRLWSQQFPNHAPLIVKLELKNGFDTAHGYGPAQLDALIAQHIGVNNLFTPSDLMGNKYTDLDSAARANAWPTVAQMTGKIMFVIQAGTVEIALTSYTSDKVYIDYMINLESQGKISQSMVFPTYLNVPAYDPRSGVRKPWYVVFGADATGYSEVDTSAYYLNHYLVIMTDSQSVPPAINDTTPSVTDEQNRVNQLAAHAATIVSSDWTASNLVSYTTIRSHPTYEAEAANNTLANGAKVQSCTGCSGGTDVGDVGNGGTLQFNDITANSSGQYTLTIWYVNGDTAPRTASISINGGAATSVSFPVTGQWDIVNVITMTVNLNAGNNTLLFSNSAAWTPDLDGISIN
jgi:Phosphoinositide phospholipase C, Ca2+-dependent/Carbohydrate binding module (family 6)